VWTAISFICFFPSYHRQMNMGLHGSWPFHRVHAAPPNNHRNLESFGLSKDVFFKKPRSEAKLRWRNSNLPQNCHEGHVIHQMYT
jgi:hypothetical protein